MEFGKQVKTNYTVDKEKLLDTFDRAVLTNSRIWLVSIQGKHFMKSPKTLQKYNEQEKTESLISTRKLSRRLLPVF